MAPSDDFSSMLRVALRAHWTSLSDGRIRRELTALVMKRDKLQRAAAW